MLGTVRPLYETEGICSEGWLQATNWFKTNYACEGKVRGKRCKLAPQVHMQYKKDGAWAHLGCRGQTQLGLRQPHTPAAVPAADAPLLDVAHCTLSSVSSKHFDRPEIDLAHPHPKPSPEFKLLLLKPGSAHMR
eukprot:scaffold241826_cov18-Tisochrysis_lutea.AAC.1